MRTNTLVASADDRGVVLHDGTEIETASIVWTAGVRPNDPLHETPQRLAVDDHLRVIGAENVFAIGDVAAAHDKHGSVLPMVSPPAMQAGRYVAKRTSLERRSDRAPTAVPLPRQGHARHDRPRARPWARSGRCASAASSGWVVWLVVHLYYLVGFENRAPGDAALGLVLRPPRPPDPHHRPGRIHPRGNSRGVPASR